MPFEPHPSDPLHYIRRAHTIAMDTKESTFRAQDELSRAWSDHAEREARGDRNLKRDRLLLKFEKRLARVRAELEQLDNEVRQGLYQLQPKDKR